MGFLCREQVQAFAKTSNKTVNKNALCCDASNCDPGYSLRDGEGHRGVEEGNPACLMTFFPSVAALPQCLGMKITIAISGSWKIALKKFDSR